jgi:ferredoxin--NADP+ reductase
MEDLSCGIFFRSVGYRGIPIPGVPFHEKGGIFPNQGGRITDQGAVVSGLYAVGWIKRGPSGVIGTNKSDSEETVRTLLGDVSQLKPCQRRTQGAVKEFLNRKGIRFVTFDDWKRIDAAEIEQGQKSGKSREKFVSREEMLAQLE